MVLTEKQQLLKKLAEGNILKEKIDRLLGIKQMNQIIQEITQDQLIEVINSINSPVALRFLLPAGVYDRARLLTLTKISQFEKQTA